MLRVHTGLIHHGRWNVTDSDGSLAITVQSVRDVFLEHSVEVGSAKAEGAQAGAPHTVRRHCPGPQFGIDANRAVVGIEIRKRT
ncbi:MAG TPA: hypothetical protein VGV35_14145, partial [Bryobacteraceae bacterium]|nr:hypothetical protein [Bryobacteraceae bacterium]